MNLITMRYILNQSQHLTEKEIMYVLLLPLIESPLCTQVLHPQMDLKTSCRTNNKMRAYNSDHMLVHHAASHQILIIVHFPGDFYAIPQKINFTKVATTLF